MDITNQLYSELSGFFLSGSVAGLILFGSHFAFNAVNYNPGLLARYIYGTTIWLLCATVALLKIDPSSLLAIAAGYWIVAGMGGLGVGLAFGIGRLGSARRSHDIEKELKLQKHEHPSVE